MTNKLKNFTPAFGSEKKKSIVKFNQITEKPTNKTENDITNNLLDSLKNETDSLQTAMLDNASWAVPLNDRGLESSESESVGVNIEKASAGITFDDSDFDKLLLEANALTKDNTSSFPSFSDDEDFRDSDEDVSSEIREEIYTEGYMQGSLDQKEIMDKRLAELQETVKSLEISSLTPETLSVQINDAISSLIKEVSHSILSEAKSSLLSDIVESKVAEFISEVKGWELITSVYCSIDEYENLLEIFSENDKAEKITTEGAGLVSFFVGNVKYIKDKDLFAGGFRIEVDRESGGKIEAVMNIDNHITNIENTLEGITS